jgi:Uma2 family endonuclease
VREYWIVDPANRTVEVLTPHQDALVTRQTASGTDEVTSPLLATSFPLAEIFAGVGEVAG